MPGETKWDLDEGRRNLRTVATNWFNIACASPIVGSEMHEIAKKEKYITKETLGADFRTAVVATKDFSTEYIQRYQYRMNLELNFVLNNDMAAGEYQLALKGFSNVIQLRADHAFAHFFAAKCFFALRNEEKAIYHKDKYFRNSRSTSWSSWVDFFCLPTEEKSFDHWSSDDFESRAEIISAAS